MDQPKTNYTNIDEYIANFPEATQEILQTVRATIHDAAPDATEKIAYGMPTFYQKGNVVHFAAWKNHIGFYPAPSGMLTFSEELGKYAGDKGSVRFPINQPLPLGLIRQIVEFRVAENLANDEAKKSAQAGKKKA